jgi:hypothetical protein
MWIAAGLVAVGVLGFLCYVTRAMNRPITKELPPDPDEIF